MNVDTASLDDNQNPSALMTKISETPRQFYFSLSSWHIQRGVIHEHRSLRLMIFGVEEVLMSGLRMELS